MESIKYKLGNGINAKCDQLVNSMIGLDADNHIWTIWISDRDQNNASYVSLKVYDQVTQHKESGFKYE